MADLRISQLPPISADQLEGADLVPVADMSAGETKSAAVRDLVIAGARALPPGAILDTQITWTPNNSSVPWATFPVHADEMADWSTLKRTGGGDYLGQLYVDESGALSFWDGTTWSPTYGGVGDIGVITSAPLKGAPVPSNTVPGRLDIVLSLEPTTGPREFLAGPTAQSGAAVYRPIVPGDLPVATDMQGGIVSVPGNGLKVANGALAIDNAVVPSGATHCAVSYNEFGLVTDGRPLAPGDMPVATNGSPGAVFPAPDLAVAPSGQIGHANTISPGAGVKVAFDARGHITGVEPVTADDVPNFDASKITSGTFPTERIGDNAITLDKLADYSIAYIQADQPAVTGIPIGTLWLSPLAQQIRMWDGNVWQPIGFGSLSEENLRLGGLFDAATGQITAVSEFGANVGLGPGATVPAPTAGLTGLYLVCTTAGSNVAATTGVAYGVGDWLLCLGAAEGWKKIGVGGGAGGGSTGVTTVTGQEPIRVTNNSTTPVVGITPATPTAAGSMSAPDKAKLDGIADGAQVNIKPDWNAPSGNPAEILNKPAIGGTVPDATTTVKGIVQLADQNAITAGTQTRVVDAAQLKDALRSASTSGEGLVRLADSAAIAAGTRGRVVDAEQLKAVNDRISSTGAPSDATTTTPGIVRLADSAAITAGTAGRVVDAQQLKAVSDRAVQADWNASSGAAAILNKPTIPTVVDASTTVKGIVQLADQNAINSSTAGRVVDAKQLRDATPAATTSVAGLVRLEASVGSTSNTTAATAFAVKSAYDTAAQALAAAEGYALETTSGAWTALARAGSQVIRVVSGCTKITFPTMPVASEVHLYNDQNANLLIVVAGGGVFTPSGWVEASVNKPAKVVPYGIANFWFHSQNGPPLTRGVTVNP